MKTTAELVQATPKNYPPLGSVTKPNLTTAELAFYSNMAEQTWRVATVRLYFLGRSIIRRAFDAGALEFCRSVTDARAKTRKEANKARAEADRRNAARAAARIDPNQRGLFGGANNAE